ncbi:iron transporter FeoA [Exiguobacterium sp. SH31]|uniref:FeoA family protein n=1 Tax=unclassified Exiguobacterium TaxID=2644629 RepID=UPI0008C8FB94|nr:MULTISPECIES: FeoA family protein [unclassified Exiguobacterium]OGX78608.1 iron transporter FeoA [Exiguobacterium sp. SH31]TCI69310.1 ferrous iron transport protein A [Exiguobacterium sp. SH0S7]
MNSLLAMPLHQPVLISDLTRIDDRLRRRMIALGFYEGCSVRIKRRAIFSGPLTIEQLEHQQMIAIRRCDAEQIGVIVP